MRLGPFNSFHMEEISGFLKERSIDHEVIQDPDAIAKMREADRAKNPGNKNNSLFRSSGDFLYLEIKSEDADRVYPIIEKYGIAAPISQEAAELLEAAEYHCLHCDYTADHPGVCKTHTDSRLLEFSEWIEASAKSGHFGIKGRLYFFVFAMVIVGGYLFLKKQGLV